MFEIRESDMFIVTLRTLSSFPLISRVCVTTLENIVKNSFGKREIPNFPRILSTPGKATENVTDFL